MKNSLRRVWYICIVCKNKGSLQPGWHGTHCHCETQVNLKLAILVCHLEEQHALLTTENAHWSHSPGKCEVPGSILVLETKLLLATCCLENMFSKSFLFDSFLLLSVGREESKLVGIINACRMIGLIHDFSCVSNLRCCHFISECAEFYCGKSILK